MMARNIILALCLIGMASVVRADVLVVSSVRPLQFIATAIVGEQGVTTSLIGYNDSPHSFTLTPQDRVAIEQADILLWIAPEFEIYLANLFTDLASSKPVITIRDLPGLTLLQFEDGSTDPHIWLDPDNALVVANALTATLSELHPAQADQFTDALAEFSDSLAASWRQIEALVASQSSPNYMVYHEAYRYFESALGLNSGGALVHNPELEPGMREVLALREQVEAIAPDCIILEPDSSPALVDTLVQNQQIARVTIDLLGNDIALGPNAYEELLLQVAQGFQTCFKATN